MSKSTIWNSLKALGYTSEQLKQETGKTYQSANEQLLQSILNKLQPTVVNEVATNDALQDITAVTEQYNVPDTTLDSSEVVTEVTETTSSTIESMINDPVNSYSFAFQEVEVKVPITVLEVYSINGKKVQVINLNDAYFIELRDDKLYVSFGLHIKTFKASDYRIVKAFNSLLNGSNFIKLRDLRENNRDILVNLNRVKTIERKKDKIVFHWNGLLTYPGVHKYTDWQVID